MKEHIRTLVLVPNALRINNRFDLYIPAFLLDLLISTFWLSSFCFTCPIHNYVDLLMIYMHTKKSQNAMQNNMAEKVAHLKVFFSTVVLIHI